MSAETFGKGLPAIFTLDHLSAMIAADRYGHRYELSPEGALSVLPPPDSAHATVASRLFAWFILAGWSPDRLFQVAGIRIPGPDGDGGRIPDLTVWARPQPQGVWLALADLLLVIEIVSPGSEGIDRVIKRQEYARAGIPRYWVVERDAAQTVTLYALGTAKEYEEVAKMPLAWLLQTAPADHHLGG